MINYKNIKVIAFDADDTLWDNESYYQESEHKFCKLLKDYASENEISKKLLDIEKQNVGIYGYGAKAFMLSMIETSLKITNNNIPTNVIEKIIIIGKSLLNKPVKLLKNVEIVLKNLQKNYNIIVATKGDSIDQKRKIKESGISHFFHHIAIMDNKTENDYLGLINMLKIRPEEFLMIGNSLKSDVLPVISIGGQAIYVPYHTTWQHEVVDDSKFKNQYTKISEILELLNILNVFYE